MIGKNTMKPKNQHKKNGYEPEEVLSVIEKKIIFFKEIIQKTILHINKNKILGILGISEVNICIEKLNEINNKIKNINDVIELKVKENISIDSIINDLQTINNEISCLFKNYGTMDFIDLIFICFGNNNIVNETDSQNDKLKFDLLLKYF